jgi:hypothetical protein
MGAQADPDLLLVERMLAPPPLADARRSLEYWERRRQTLPLYRRRARREAREMAGRWEDRVRAAERLRFESSPIGKLLAALGISSSWFLWLRFGRRGLRRTAWAIAPQKLKLIVGAVAATSLLVMIAAAAFVVFLLAQL